VPFWYTVPILFFAFIQISHYLHVTHTLYWNYIKCIWVRIFLSASCFYCQGVIRYFTV
jgi:hypothetical protein